MFQFSRAGVYAFIFTCILILFGLALSTGFNNDLANEAIPPSSQSAPFKSAIQPIRSAQAQTESPVSNSTQVPTRYVESNKELVERFNQAVELHKNGDLNAARQLYQSVLRSDPNAVVASYNLAVLAMKQGHYETAREALQSALEENDATRDVNHALQELLRYQAALSYAKALGNDAPRITPPELPILDQYNSTSSEKVKELEHQLAQQRETYSANLADLEAQHERTVSSLRAQLSAGNTNQASSQDELIAKNEALSSELQSAKLEIAELKSTLAAQAVKSSSSDAESEALAGNTTDSQSNVASEPFQAQDLEQRVKSWAAAWARQDVNAYLDHYAEDFRTATLTHEQWVAQRRVRLTNKGFIRVDVSQFAVEILDAERASVTFKQRYRSNSFDDTITKRLTFRLSPDSSGAAKIIDEAIVGNN